MKPAEKLPHLFFSVYTAGQRRMTGRARGFRHVYALLAQFMLNNLGWPDRAQAEAAAAKFLGAELTNIRWGGKVRAGYEPPEGDGDITPTGEWAVRDLKYVAPPPAFRYLRLYMAEMIGVPERHVATVIETNARQAIKRVLALGGAALPFGERDFCWKDDGAVGGPARMVWHSLPTARFYLPTCKADFSHLEEHVCVSMANTSDWAHVVKMADVLVEGIGAKIDVTEGHDVHTLRAIVEDIPREAAKNRNYIEAHGGHSTAVPTFSQDAGYTPKPARWEDGKGWINMYMRDSGGVQPGGVYASKADAQYIADQNGNGKRNVAVLITWKPFAEAKGVGAERGTEKAWSLASRSSREYYMERLGAVVRAYDSNMDGRMHITPDVAHPDMVVISYGGGCWQENRDRLRRWLASVGIAFDTPNDRRSCTRVVWAALRNALRVGG